MTMIAKKKGTGNNIAMRTSNQKNEGNKKQKTKKKKKVHPGKQQSKNTTKKQCQKKKDRKGGKKYMKASNPPGQRTCIDRKCLGWYIPHINFFLEVSRSRTMHGNVKKTSDEIYNPKKNGYPKRLPSAILMNGYVARKRKKAGIQKAERLQRNIAAVAKKLCQPERISKHARERRQQRGLDSVPVYVFDENEIVVVTFLPLKEGMSHQEQTKAIKNYLADTKRLLAEKTRASKRLHLPRTSISTPSLSQHPGTYKKLKKITVAREQARRKHRREKAYQRAGCLPFDRHFFLRSNKMQFVKKKPTRELSNKNSRVRTTTKAHLRKGKRKKKNADSEVTNSRSNGKRKKIKKARKKLNSKS